MDELRQEIEQLKKENQMLRERLTQAEALIQQLQQQLNQNSHNSNRPPSRDYSRRKKRSLRRKSQRKAGGQKGHPGQTLKATLTPDTIVVHRPTQCQGCHQHLDDKSVVIDKQQRQVFDLPPLHYLVTEHQAETLECPHCQTTTTGIFPKAVTQPVQYGAGVQQLATYLRIEQFVPYKRSQQLLQDLFGLSMSTGSLQTFLKRAAQRVDPAIRRIKEAVVSSDVAHVDETGFYINGKRHWLHTVSTNRWSYYTPHPNRGFKATEAAGILPHFKGTLVHDAWQTYFKYDQASHGLCNVHHLRELNGLIETTQQQWPVLMKQFLLATLHLVREAKQDENIALSTETEQQVSHLYDAIVAIGLGENPRPDKPPPKKKRGRRKQSKARNLVERFAKHKSAILCFAHDFKVPFDNNLAERDIRMMKVQQKISGCFRSDAGAEQFCRLRSYTATVRKQGMNIWEAIGSLFCNEIQMPQLTPV